MDALSRSFESLWTLLGAHAGPYAARVLGALAIALAAWLGARLARAAAQRAATRARLEERLGSTGLAATLGGVASAAVWLLALPALLGTLELHGLLAPVNAMLSRLMGFVPNVVGAAVVLAIGLLVARIARQLVSGLARAAGAERVAEKLGLAGALGAEGLSGLAGRIVFVLLLLPTVMAALQPLGMDALTQPLSRLFDTLIGIVPRLLSAALVLGIAVFVGRALANLTAALLAGAGLDRLPARLMGEARGAADAAATAGSAAGSAAASAASTGAPPPPAAMRFGGRALSEWVGSAVMAGLVLAALAQATEIIGLPVLTELVATLGAALARLAVAAVLLLAGVLLAAAAARAVEATPWPNARALGFTARAAILFFAGALAMRQAGLPAEIVGIAFGAVVGAVAIAVAVAFGLGGREVAARTLARLAASFEAPAGAASAVSSAADAAATPIDTRPGEGRGTSRA